MVLNVLHVCTQVYTCTSIDSTCSMYDYNIYICVLVCVQFTNSKQGGDEELERESDIHTYRQKTTHMYVHICVSDACVPKKKEVSF